MCQLVCAKIVGKSIKLKVNIGALCILKDVNDNQG